MQQAEEYRVRAAEMRALAKKVQPDLAVRYLELAKAYDDLAEQRVGLVSVREKLDRSPEADPAG